MDLGSESVEENEVTHDGIENGTKDEGSSGFGDGNSDANTEKADQPGTVVQVACEEAVNPKVTPTKGFGLRKWRRIRRNVVKDPNVSVDSSKVLKRGLSGGNNLNEMRDVKEKSDGSPNMFENPGFSDVYSIPGSSPDSRYAVGSGFAVGTDSENSEDRSSKSSTAASEPKLKYEKSRSKNVNLKNLANLTQRVQQGNARVESNKKPGGGGKVKMEKENSVSSVESDSRSSNFKQGYFTVTSNGYGEHSGRPTGQDDGNTSEGVHANEHFSGGVQSRCGNKNMGEDEENIATNSSWDATEEKSVNNHSSTNEDPLIGSISSLQAIQEALEEEVLKLKEMEIEVVSPDDDSTKCSSASAGTTLLDAGLHKPYLSGQSDAAEAKQTATSSLELEVLSLTQNVNILESKLEGLQGMLALKDSRIAELENALNSGRSPKEESASTIGISEEKRREEECELEGLFLQKIEAEVEYLAITKVMQNLKSKADCQRTLLEEQEKLSENQAQVLNEVVEAENRASVLKKKAEELEKGDSLVVEESFVLQKRVCKLRLGASGRIYCLASSLLLFGALILSPQGFARVPAVPVHESPNDTPSPVFKSPNNSPSPVFESPNKTPSPVFKSPSNSPSPAFKSPNNSPFNKAPIFESPNKTPSPVFESPNKTPSPTLKSPNNSPLNKAPIYESPNNSPFKAPYGTPN
ncbi:hypothetical protein Ahy_A05g021714 [Arachis hypogaea]|uniref:WPP domain-interacting protein n=1 Tax=Arachis hypogaea TaxID=3818 RepID=A0A445CY75_ARAHY|nr:hypothetical protein Ahy_A05g021714 [Arachis hypogaea]